MNSKVEIRKLLEKHLYNLYGLYSYFELYKGLHPSNDEESKKIHKIGKFYFIIKNSLSYTIIMNLALILGRDSKSMGVFNVINIIKANYNCFDNKIYNDFINVDTGENERFCHNLNIKQEISDFEKQLDKYKTTIDNISKLRTKIYAHLDKQTFLDSDEFKKTYNITGNNVEDIINILRENLNIIYCNLTNGIVFGYYPSEAVEEYKMMISKL